MNRRRGVGVGAVKKKQQQAKAFEEVGKRVADENFQHVTSLLESFKTNLEEFAVKYKKDIRADPAFRQQFQTMCAKIGVDPLASNKGFWAEILGVGDFYYELALQVTEVCLARRAATGGLLAVGELLARLEARRTQAAAARDGGATAITRDDVRRAVGKLKALGSGYQLVHLGPHEMVLSVPLELSRDTTEALAAARARGGELRPAEDLPGWAPARVDRAVRTLLREGLAWEDAQGGEAGCSSYWVPSMWFGRALQEEEEEEPG